MPAPLPEALRAKILAAFKDGQTSSVQLAERFKVSQPTVSRLIRRYRATQSITPMPHGGGRAPLVPKSLHKAVRKFIGQEAGRTANDVADFLGLKLKQRPSQWTAWRLMKKLGFRYKKVSLESDESKRPDVQKKRKRYAKAVKKVDPKRLVFLDETGVNASMTQDRGWALRGQKALKCRSIRDRKNVTVVGAMRSTGLVTMRSISGGMKKRDFISFVKNTLSPHLKRNDILVMDNLASHHAIEVVEAVSRRGASVTFLPPYSPDFNPIEMLWNNLKQRFRKRFRRFVQTVKRSVGGCWRSLRDLDLRKFLPPCGYSNPSQANC